MPSNLEGSSSNPPLHNSQGNATPPSRSPSVSLVDEKDGEIACWKCAYQDVLAENTNKTMLKRKISESLPISTVSFDLTSYHSKSEDSGMWNTKAGLTF
jgi:hypothetical protein